MIANNGFPTLADSPHGIPGGLQKGDIIFNHQQAEDILKHGYVTGSHARMVGGKSHAKGTVSGSAFGSGTGPSLSSYTTSGRGSSGGNTIINTGGAPVTVKASTAQVDTKETDDADKIDKVLAGSGKLLPVDKTTEYFDLVEVRLNKLERTLNKIKSSAESAFESFGERVSFTSQEIKQLTTNIGKAKEAATTYQKQANKFITSGTYKLTDDEMDVAGQSGIADSKVYKAFKNAKSAYSKKKTPANKTALKNARKALRENIRDVMNNGRFEIDSITYDSKAQTKYDKAKEKYENKKTTANRKARDKAKNALDKENAKQSLKDKLSQYNEWRDKRASADELRTELLEQRRQAYVDRFDLVKEEYDAEIERLQLRNDLMEDWISMNENKGYITSSAAYYAIRANQENKLTSLENKRSDLEAQMREAMKHGTDKGSEAFYQMQNEIDSVNKEIYSLNAGLAETEKKIRELEKADFKRLIDRINDLAEEAAFFNEVMSENPLYDKDTGNITDYGLATLAMDLTQYDTYMAEVEEYAKKIKEVRGEVWSDVYGENNLKKNPYNQELIETEQEYIELQRQAIQNAYKERAAIKSVVEDGIKKQIDALKKAIDEYTKMLDTQKSEYEYAKSITEQQEKISNLRKRLAAWRNDETEEGAVRRQKTAKELADAEQEMAEKQEDRRIAQTKEMLSALSDDYNELLNSRLDNIDGLIADVRSSVDGAGSTIANTINGLFGEDGKLGYNMTDPMVDLLKDIEGNTKPLSESILHVIEAIGAKTQEQINAAAQATADAIKRVNADSKEVTTTLSGGGSGSGSKTTTTKADKIKAAQNNVDKYQKLMKQAQEEYYNAKNEYQRLKKDKASTKSINAAKKDAEKWKAKYYSYKTSYNKALSNLRSIRGYATGNKKILEDELAWTQERGGEMIMRKSDGAMLTPLGKGDMVFTNNMSKNLWEFAKDPMEFMKVAPKMSAVASKEFNFGDSNVDITFNLPNVADANDFMNTLQKSKKFEQLVQSITIGRINGKGSLNKYSVKI